VIAFLVRAHGRLEKVPASRAEESGYIEKHRGVNGGLRPRASLKLARGTRPPRRAIPNITMRAAPAIRPACIHA
jgi:hypothetical protein